jgi:hypothetical protein
MGVDHIWPDVRHRLLEPTVLLEIRPRRHHDAHDFDAERRGVSNDQRVLRPGVEHGREHDAMAARLETTRQLQENRLKSTGDSRGRDIQEGQRVRGGHLVSAEQESRHLEWESVSPGS